MQYVKESKYWLFFGLCFFWIGQQGLYAQTQQDSLPATPVLIDHADTLEYFQRRDTLEQRLIGAVELRQDSIYMYCDSAIIRNENQVIAEGNVIIQQGDSLHVFADSLYYDGALKQAFLYGEVILERGEQKLFTQQLEYNLNTKVATYEQGAVMTSGQSQLSSKRGYYFVDQETVFFKDSVIIIDSTFNLVSDTLQFNTKTRTATFLAPTLIQNDSIKIYCEAGFYDTQNGIAEFRKNAQFKNGDQEVQGDIIRYEGETDVYTISGNARYKSDGRDLQAEEIFYDSKKEIYRTRGRSRIVDANQILEADTVDYDSKTQIGLAFGNVTWRDTSENLSIRCQTAEYNQATNYLKATGGRPLLINVIDGDTLFLAADTLLASTLLPDSTQTDTSRLLLAYPDVRIFKSDLQAICDSLSYNTGDSLFQFFKQPLIWSDTSQFSADTISLRMRNDQIDRILLYKRAFIINSPDEIYFNQIKGRDITALFQENELRRMHVQGNAESVYYALDSDNAYIGANKTVCSEMLLFFGNNSVERIKFLIQAQAKLNPMQTANHNDLKLEGFRWETLLRPRSLADILRERSSMQ